MNLYLSASEGGPVAVWITPWGRLVTYGPPSLAPRRLEEVIGVTRYYSGALIFQTKPLKHP